MARRIARAWFVLLVAMQLAFVAVLPAGQGNDETGHLIRMWALTDGHFYCDKMPQAVRELEAMNFYTWRTRGQSYRAYWRRGLALSGGERVDGNNYECGYFPLALVLPALATRAVALDLHGEPRTGGVFLASYAARLAGLAALDVALWWLLTLLPWAAPFALGFFSLPMAIEQSISVGHDSALMALAVLMLAVMFSRDDWIGVGLLVLCATAMTLIKPVYGGFVLLAGPMVWRRLSGWRLAAALAALPAIPWAAFRLWYRFGDLKRRYWHPHFSDPDRQMALLRKPWKALSVLGGYWHYFIDDHKLPDFMPHRINGVWTTLFFANAWTDMAMTGYYFAIAGLVAALAAAAAWPGAPAERRAPWWVRAAAVAGVAAAVPATIFALYVVFSPVDAPGPYGVVGRYHAIPFLTLSVLALGRLRRSWSGAPLLAILAALLLFAADGYALAATWRYYWL
jgi:MFS family permease